MIPVTHRISKYPVNTVWETWPLPRFASCLPRSHIVTLRWSLPLLLVLLHTASTFSLWKPQCLLCIFFLQHLAFSTPFLVWGSSLPSNTVTFTVKSRYCFTFYSSKMSNSKNTVGWLNLVAPFFQYIEADPQCRSTHFPPLPSPAFLQASAHYLSHSLSYLPLKHLSMLKILPTS